ncbi:ABC transporter permease [Gimibacter soli]|uniref:ABC transporter permease n=1 Tax=Gimibacter soli TaxID=3024400 RepID=A0AAF0BLC7_9PROT|nr:ABC transporter permease [Gimibacter soli]WCL53987.1 ABC transporter permease [Gimibacter soli]
MLQNYIKTALRNLMRNKLFSVINIAGLAIGLAAFILIVLFVRDEFSWDDHWARADDLYRIENTYVLAGHPDRRTPNAVDPLKDLMLDTYPEVEDITRYISADVTIQYHDDLYAQQVVAADENFLSFFQFRFLEGDVATAFDDPRSIVLSHRTAQKYFGDAPALGKVLPIRLAGQFVDFKVSGVIEDPVVDTTVQSDFIVPFVRDYFLAARWFSEDWRFAYRSTFMRVAPGTDVDLIRNDLPALVERHMHASGDGMETGTRWSVKTNLVPLGKVHLEGANAAGDIDVLYGFLGVALLILIIAVVNFLNLSMARTAHRAREVAMRKVLGAARRQIVQQFLGESILLAFVALTIALALVEVALPHYNAFLSSVVELDLVREPAVLLLLLVLGLGVGISAGSFQAAYFAMLRPHDVLYSSTSADNGTGRLRQLLVVAQFSISAALMIIAFFVNKQTQYMQALDLGFNPDNLIVVAGTNNEQSETLKNRLLASPHIKAVGRSSDVPTEGSEDRLQMRPVTGGDLVTLDGLTIGPDFFKAYEIDLLAGRYLSPAEADVMRARADEATYKQTGNIVINASAAKLLGFTGPDAAIGRQATVHLTSDLLIDATIVGVVDDFHFDSARDVIRPGIYYVDEQRQSDMSVRIDGTNRDAALEAIRDAWRETYPGNILDYRSMAELVELQYQTDNRLGDMLTIFTLLAVTISAMGLYGLASFTAERRTREIGIRKVLGASLMDIVTLFLWQFSKPILIANLIAWPVAFYFLSGWLDGFAYRVALSPLPFVMAALAALLIGWITVAGRAFMVARANPINALRYE